MTRFSRIFFGLLVAVLLVWQLPWGINYLMVKSEGTPFTLYSEVLGDFAMIRRGGVDEAAAHRLLQKHAMNSGVSLRRAAEEILQKYGEDESI